MDEKKKGKRAERLMQTEFPTVEAKKQFYEFCYERGQVPAKVIRILIQKFMDGEINL
jgi:hypothetical protein